jgi:hypothetical protein
MRMRRTLDCDWTMRLAALECDLNIDEYEGDVDLVEELAVLGYCDLGGEGGAAQTRFSN